jgi:hypothetical protein
MALLSLKNFRGPLTNPVHLVTIVLVTVLFGVFRWSGGGLSFSSGNRLAASGAGEETVAEDTGVERPAAGTTKPAKPPVARNQDLLGDMLKSDQKAVAAKPTQKPKDKSAGDAGLADIEKSLGLRE